MTESTPLDLSRREIVGGGLLLGLVFLAGCQNQQAASEEPVEPIEPARTARGPVPFPGGRRPPDDTTLPEGVLPRSAWTKAGVARPQNILPMRGVTQITVHHDGMDAFTSTSQADAARRLENIRVAHLARKAKDGSPWADIGYHFSVDPAGRVWECRSVQFQGAHVQDHNEHNLGVMVMGNFELQRPTPAALASLDRFVASQMRRYSVPVARVYTHRELNPTACPGKNLQQYMLATRSSGGAMRLA